MTPACRRLGRPLLTLGAAVTVVAMLWHLPRVGATTWTDILGVLTGLAPHTLAVLAVVWLGGMVAHTLVQVAALPGLSHPRALVLNLASSAVASGLPGGGPLSLAANWAILRSWGFSAGAFSTYTLVTTVTLAAAKLTLPLLTGAAVLVGGGTLTPMVRDVVLVAAATLAVAVAVAALLALLPDRLPRRVLAASAATARRAWRGLLTGAVLQLALQYVLFLLCLRVTGNRFELLAAAVAFATGRVLSALPITPGGLGVTETGTGAVLVALGGDPAAAVAGVVLFSVFMVLLEIPLGAVGLLLWRVSDRRRRLLVDGA